MTPDIAGEDHDEPHQRAMYFAHGDINGFDFWGEAAFPKWSDHSVSTFGRTVFRTVNDMPHYLGRLNASANSQSFRRSLARVEWVNSCAH
jgi:hypothetical protein